MIQMLDTDKILALFDSGTNIKKICSLVGSYPRAVRNILRNNNRDSAKYRNRFGVESNGWNGGKARLNGYVRVLMRGHPRALSNNYVLEHIVVAEKKVGRPLVYYGYGDHRNEVVHHINGEKSDNRPENLEILTNRDHLILEWKENPEKFPQSKYNQKFNQDKYQKWYALNYST